jgi:hypothetical protein
MLTPLAPCLKMACKTLVIWPQLREANKTGIERVYSYVIGNTSIGSVCSLDQIS